jgi:hypothetical protein
VPSRSRKIGFLIASVLLAVAVSAIWYRSGEPSYAGTPLSVWILYIRSPMRAPQAVEAVQAIGTNAIPFLLEWMEYEEPNRPKDTERFLRFIPGHKRTGDRIALGTNAAFAFSVLGPAGETAIPALTAVMAKSKSLDVRARAAEALKWIGKPAVPALIATLTNDHRTYTVRSLACTALGGIGTNALPAVPHLNNLLSQSLPGVLHGAATNALFQILSPALTNRSGP